MDLGIAELYMQACPTPQQTRKSLFNWIWARRTPTQALMDLGIAELYMLGGVEADRCCSLPSWPSSPELAYALHTVSCSASCLARGR